MTNKKNTCAPRKILLEAAMIRLGDINHEILEGYEIIRDHHKTVTIFGSARIEPKHKWYQAARELSYKLAELDYSIITGGGHGIMEAGNRGAMDAGGDSIGFNINLPHEQTLNPYTTQSLAFSHFAPRKIVMTMYADAYVYFPGGFGTLDELSEILTLIQTGKIPKAPVILYDSSYWNEFDNFVQKSLIPNKLVGKTDDNLYTITDDIEEIVKTIKSNHTYCDE